MIFVELFYHCDHDGCEAHGYVPGDPVVPTQSVARLPQELPAGWTYDVEGKVRCLKHSPMVTMEAKT